MVDVSVVSRVLQVRIESLVWRGGIEVCKVVSVSLSVSLYGVGILLQAYPGLGLVGCFLLVYTLTDITLGDR